MELSKSDSLRVLDLLENPPAPNERLLAAAKALPRPKRPFCSGTKSPSAKGMTVTASIAASRF